MEGIKSTQEKSYDPFLEELWFEYGFHGKPPFAGSIAENKLKEACDKYADCVDHDKKMLPGEEVAIYDGSKKISTSETYRRELHDQIAVMIAGRQRTGMEEHLAMHITNFAYEYSRGYKIGEDEKYKEKAA
jgi:hypothetical protein